MKSPLPQPFRMAALTVMGVLVYGSTLGCNSLLDNERKWNGPLETSSSEHDASASSKVTESSGGVGETATTKPNSTDTNLRSSTSDTGRVETSDTGRVETSDTGRVETSNAERDTGTETSRVGTSTGATGSSDAGSSATVDVELTSTNHPSTSHPSTDDTSTPEDGGTCPIAECEADEVICALGERQSCDLNEQGCLVWSEAEICAWGVCENETTCLDCSQGGEGCPACEGESCPIPVGQPCIEGDTCVAGSCQQTSAGPAICCASSCDSACLACAPSGESCVALTDDAACGTVTCPPDNPCRNYTAESVTDNRCADGMCGSPDEVCPYVVRNDGEECSDTHLCDTLGNCSVPKLALGAACEEGSACTSEYCVDGVCCENECDGVCMQCNAGTGSCDVTPVDDDECSDVECSRWNTDCTSALGNITTDHCAGFGLCKSELSCPIENRPRGTSCAGHYLYVCDGEGECGFPTVECGQTTCVPKTDSGSISAGCCYNHPDVELSPLACEGREECNSQSQSWSVGCDEQVDCSGELSVCCGVGVTDYGWLECLTPAECNVFSYPFSTAEVCESPAMGSVPCSNGGACTSEVDTLPGFKFCTRT